MTNTTLFDAARADLRTKLLAVRNLYDLERALATLSDGIDTLRDSITERDKSGPSEELNRIVLADLLAVGTLSQEFAALLATHRTSVAVALFGVGALPKA